MTEQEIKNMIRLGYDNFELKQGDEGYYDLSENALLTENGLLTVWNKTLNTWNDWYQRIKSGLPMDKWIKQGPDADSDSYLPSYLEHCENLFGSARSGNNTYHMIVLFENKLNKKELEKYVGKIWNGYKGKYCERINTNDYEKDYNDNIQELLKEIVNVSKLDELYSLEKGKKNRYDNYSAKQILQKISILMSLRDDSSYKYEFLWIFNEDTINELCKKFKIDVKGDTILKKNHKLCEKLKEWCDLKYDAQKKTTNSNYEDEYRTKFYKLYTYIWNTYCLKLGKEGKDIKKLIDAGFKQIVLTGAPGTGKTFLSKKIAQFDKLAQTINTDKDLKYQFVQFHPSFDYTDFVEGLRPVQIKKGENPTFVRMDGIFKAFCRRAARERDKELRYYFIIDEINRADLSKVFGELMYCLEYRGEEGAIQTQYSNLPTFTQNDDKTSTEAFVELKDDVFADGFYIPKNVIILGTMNDIDRSVESFDFALRRRFKWIEIKTSEVMKEILNKFLEDRDDKASEVKKLNAKANALNAYIASRQDLGLSESYNIGPAYFKSFAKYDKTKQFEKAIEEIFENEIEGTLLEYVRGRDQETINKFIAECKKKMGIEDKKSKTNKDDNPIE